jgi:UDP-N-acetylmuramate--alanine ligase
MGKNYFKAHFIGVGGIGISALARYYLTQGWKVSGSDIGLSDITKDLENLGAEIYQGSRSLKTRMPSVVIYSPAVKKDDPELEEARNLDIKTMSYPEALGELTKKMRTIAVAGAHGKSTTTVMMIDAKLDPTVIVGTKVKEFGGSNFRLGKSENLVIEACEYDRSFLNYWPSIAVVTNIEMDHMECYRDEPRLFAAFLDFANHVPETGALVAYAGDANSAKLAREFAKKGIGIREYSLNQPEAKKIRSLMKIPGDHNIANALAALSVGRILKIPDAKIYASLAKYKGSWRRFEESPGAIGGKKVILVSDYGHHPTQIRLTMEAARAKWPKKKIICVYQPHQAYRTYLLFDEFVKSLKGSPADLVIIADIYQVASREKPSITKRVSSKSLAKAVGKKNVEYVMTGAIMDRLDKEVAGGEVVLVMGAGDIYDLAKTISQEK